MEKIKISAVSYLNTKPFIYGIFRSSIGEKVDLQLDIPSECARKLLAGEVDLALAPVAIIPELGESYLVSDFCIGAENKVRTVCIYAECALESIEVIYLDFHSRTSVMLAQVLCREYWGIRPQFINATDGFEQLVKGTTAALVIGDRTVAMEQKKHTYAFDLGEAWRAWTGLPFVFAAWVSRKPLPESFVAEFNAALGAGLDALPQLIQILPHIPGFDLDAYFRQHISYELDGPKMEGLHRFLRYLDPTVQFKLHHAGGVLAGTL